MNDEPRRQPPRREADAGDEALEQPKSDAGTKTVGTKTVGTEVAAAGSQAATGEVAPPPTAAQRAAERHPSAQPRERLQLLRSGLEAVVVALLLVFFVVTTVRISGSSMEPTLHHGERALVPRYETWLHRAGIGSFTRGDIVYFPSPTARGRFCPPLCPFLIKRIVAVGGDVVAIDRGRLTINGVVLDEAYLGGRLGSDSMAPQRIPAGHVFVLGDNRGPLGSVDSRRFGPVPTGKIAGRVVMVIWPPLRRTADGWRPGVRLLRKPAAFRAPLAPAP